MNIIVALLIFGLVVLVHEFGHYITAVKSGILVEEFAIGMGPILLKKQGKETLYTIRAFPLGGFCKMLGEDEDLMVENSFNSKSVRARMLVISGGVIMNIILAFITFFVVFSYLGYSEPVVYDVMDGYESPLQQGDRVYSIDGYKVNTQRELGLRLSDASADDIRKGEEPVIDLVYIRDGEKNQIDIPLRKSEDGRYLIGFYLNNKSGIFGEEVEGIEKATFMETAKQAVYEMNFVIESTFYGLKKLVTDEDPLSIVAGPIGIIGVIGDTYEQSMEQAGLGIAFLNMLYLAGLISANLAVFNLLPFPALDGGRLVFLSIEGITGKPVPPKIEGYIHLMGFILLISLAIVIAVSDVIKLF